MVIYLPPPKTVEINSSSPIEVKASRKYPKKMPAFRIEIKDPIFDEGCLSSIQYPEFIGGLNKFIDYIRRGIVYPEKAISNNIEGTVQIAFTIEKDGSIGAVNVIMGIGYGCDEQIVRLIKNAPRWRPGILCGRPFSIQETVSIKFTLTDK
jgi:TonB family protein